MDAGASRPLQAQRLAPEAGNVNRGVLVAVVFSALATPAADIVSMLMLAGMLVVLFFAAAGLSMLFDRRRAKRAAAILPPEAIA